MHPGISLGYPPPPPPPIKNAWTFYNAVFPNHRSLNFDNSLKNRCAGSRCGIKIARVYRFPYYLSNAYMSKTPHCIFCIFVRTIVESYYNSIIIGLNNGCGTPDTPDCKLLSLCSLHMDFNSAADDAISSNSSFSPFLFYSFFFISVFVKKKNFFFLKKFI